MLNTEHVTEFDPDLPATLAFRIAGEVGAEEMRAMSDRVLAAFDRHPKIDLLFVFDRFEGAGPGASLTPEAAKAEIASLWKVRNYVVAGAPDSAARTLERMGALLPVTARTFESEAEARAWLAAQPAPA
jgi:hypothetical protein